MALGATLPLMVMFRLPGPLPKLTESRSKNFSAIDPSVQLAVVFKSHTSPGEPSPVQISDLAAPVTVSEMVFALDTPKSTEYVLRVVADGVLMVGAMPLSDPAVSSV